MEFLTLFGLFLLKAITIVLAILVVLAAFFALARKPKPKIELKSINDYWGDIKSNLKKEIFNEKIKKIKPKKTDKNKPCLYVLEFAGDIRASQVEHLREEISAILTVAKPLDEVVIRLESPGGVVNGYGLGASQLQRIRDKNISLTVCIDKVAASGGYLMAAVANKIVASPFAILGSIGVVAQIPNFYRWLKKHDIDVELLTAGEYKRTLTLFAENTEKGREKFRQELEVIHKSFRDYVLQHRSKLDMEKVATGEHWLALDAYQLGLVDELKTSDEYIINKLDQYQVYSLKIEVKQSILTRLLKPATQMLNPWA